MNPEVDDWKAGQLLHLTDNEPAENFAGKIEWNPSDWFTDLPSDRNRINPQDPDRFTTCVWNCKIQRPTLCTTYDITWAFDKSEQKDSDTKLFTSTKIDWDLITLDANLIPVDIENKIPTCKNDIIFLLPKMYYLQNWKPQTMKNKPAFQQQSFQRSLKKCMMNYILKLEASLKSTNQEIEIYHSELVMKRIEQNNNLLLKHLQSRSANIWPKWKIRIPFCSKILIDNWLKPHDGVTKYGQTCVLNFANNGYFFDSGEATTENNVPEWQLDCLLNKGIPLIFKINNKQLRYGGIREKRILNEQEEIEFSGHWNEKIQGDWKRVETRK